MPFEVFGDFGSAGGFNTPASPFWDRQTCLNWYPEVSPSKGSKTAVALLGTPGLNQLVAPPGGGAPGFSQTMTAWPQPSAVTNLPVRGLWPLPGQTQALAVIAQNVYLVTISQAATATSLPVLQLKQVGQLATSLGPVSIRDNGLGGYAVIVDGPNGYLYNVSTQILTSFPGFLGGSTVAFIDGYWIFSVPNTQTFYTNQAPYSLTINPTFFANNDSYSDRLMACHESKEQLWLLNEQTTSIWYNAGGQFFPFQRLVGTMLQVGCKATYSVARFSSAGQDGLAWLGRSDRGENIVVRSRGLGVEVVSTPAVSDAIAQYPVQSDAIGYTYQEDGHEFYVLTFPTADATWVFDGSVPIEYAWHQRASYDPYAQLLHRHRSNAFMDFAGMRIVGDYQNGALYQLTRNAFTDAGWPILSRRRAPKVWNKESRQRVFMGSLQCDFAPGQGTATGIGSSPVANLRVSRDGGATFGQRWPAPLGAQGQFQNRTLWRKLGWGRDNVFEIEVMQPVNRDLIGATLKAMGEP